MTLRALPNNMEAEQGLLGAILINNDAFYRVSDFLSPEHFFWVEHRDIYDTAGKLIRAGKIATPVTLKTFFADKNVNGFTADQYLARLCAEATTIINAGDYGKIVAELAKRRSLISIAETLAKECYDAAPDAGAETLIEKAEISLFDLAENEKYGTGFQTFDKVLTKTLDMASKAFSRDGGLSGLATGLIDLDNQMGGLQPADLIILAARPSMGKTALATNIAYRIADNGAKVGFFSLEMSAEQLGTRIVSEQTNIPSTRIRRGSIDQESFNEIARVITAIQNLPLYIDECGGLSIGQIAARARRLKRTYGLDFLVIDYLQLASGTTRRSSEHRVAEITEITTKLKALAKELNVPILALSQLSRAVEQREDKRPQLTDLRDCLPASALILNADTGERVPIEDIINKNLRFNVWALDDRYKLKKRPITSAWAVGRQAVFKVTTKCGRILRCTGGHRLRTVSGWQELRSLTTGEMIALPREYGSLSFSDQSVTEDQAVLLGWLIGDAHLRGCAALTVANEVEAELAVALAMKCFKLKPRIRLERADTPARRVTMTTGMMCGGTKNPLTTWLRGIQAWGFVGADKHVPKIIFRTDKAIIAAFLRGLFHADGCFTARGTSPTIKLVTISERLAYDVQHLLIRLGINAVVSANCRNIGGFQTKTKILWTVSIQQRNAVGLFLANIGFLGQKHDRAIAQFQPIALSDAGKIDRLPIAINDQIHVFRTAAGLSHMDLGWRNQGKRMSRSTCAQIGKKLSNEWLLCLGVSDVIWDEIKNIEENGEENVFDISVASDHSFCVDDYVTHNSGSIEQDADVVLFVHRDEYYVQMKKPPVDKPEEMTQWVAKAESVRGKAELIIAKQRHGPIGTIDLQFQAEVTRFDNLSQRRGENA
jgi:replicative DNA helicase